MTSSRKLTLVVLALLIVMFVFSTRRVFSDCPIEIGSNIVDVDITHHEDSEITMHKSNPHAQSMDWDSVSEIPLTVVTAYWNIGSLSHGVETEAKNPQIYTKYLTTFKYIDNPVIGYFDDLEIAEKFRQIRQGLPTKIYIKDCSDLWAFQIEPRIRKIYSNPSYPYHIPNTSSSLYAAATHAKYDVMPDAAAANPFNTKYFAWLDAGYFREMVDDDKGCNFTLTLPIGFNSSSVAYNVAFKKRTDTAVHKLIKWSYTWISGGLFFGTKKTITTLSKDYKKTLIAYMDLGYTNTDQQILYALHSPLNNLTKPNVNIQEYLCIEGYDKWMSLGLYIRDMWYNHTKSN